MGDRIPAGTRVFHLPSNRYGSVLESVAASFPEVFIQLDGSWPWQFIPARRADLARLDRLH